ncbi:helix-turn-helix domain-containing protein [Hymenobacter cellulosivorans]|uniref:Helix-turn-helix domain-containing protein n=1 Tax=Hymenobacter cellulosivorans TaxID=2932249 RepID=A0ABY4F576_9BACT|nr:helix-turn-helix transcriptional regulator [Hymenobacter cellulosivorans]UOQ51297.1 helix-turn-helix domain-containing protein [Hymenobacter cellulosivorans]
MPNQSSEGNLRQLLGLTQLELAVHLRISRDLLAQVEINRRQLPTPALIRLAPLLTLHSANGGTDKEPPLADVEANSQHPDAAPGLKEVRQRIGQCQNEVDTIRYQLEKLRRQALPLRRRIVVLTPVLAALPPAPTDGSPDPDARDRSWYTDLLADARWQLTRFGAVPQAQLDARIQALDLEIAALQRLLPPAKG